MLLRTDSLLHGYSAPTSGKVHGLVPVWEKTYVAAMRREHTLKRIKLWHIPPRSPDLNPVEQVWAHLKRKLRAMDLADAVSQRPLLGKTAYKLRVRRLVRSRSFQRIAANVAMGLKKTCKEVIRKRGAAAGR